jgi:hypothetical protein
MAVLPCLKSGIAIVRIEVFRYVSQMVMTLLHPVQSYIYVYLNLKTLIQLQT